MSIAKACVNLLGGKIWFTSEEGTGSNFYFKIKFEPTTVEHSEDSGKKDMDITFNKEMILIAEDDNYNFEYLKDILTEQNLQCIRTLNGKETVRLAVENENIRLVLMDIRLPGLTGDQATMEIKQQRPNLPIIAQTAYAMNDDRVEYMKAGFDDYITKPIDRNLLIRLMKKNLVGNIKV